MTLVPPWLAVLFASIVVGLVGSAGADTSRPAGWIQVSAANAFSIWAPPGTRHVPERGTDSLVGRFSAPGFEIRFDFGAYSDPLKQLDGYRNIEASEIVIDGRPARLVRANRDDGNPQGRLFIGLHVPRVAVSPLGAIKLTITSVTDDAQVRDLLVRIVETLRFKAPN